MPYLSPPTITRLIISRTRVSHAIDHLNRVRSITKPDTPIDTFLTISKRDKRQGLKVNENLIQKSNEGAIDTENTLLFRLKLTSWNYF